MTDTDTHENPSGQWMEPGDRSPDEAKFFWTGGPVQVAPESWFASLGSGVTAFATGEGLVLIDSGTRLFAPEMARLIRGRTDLPVHTAVYTHGHVDHAFGLSAFLHEGQPLPRIIGQAAMADRFTRYERTPQHNATINSRQFGGRPDDPAFREQDLRFGAPEHPPNLYYQNDLELSVGGVRFELHACRGETDDHTWVYCPERGVLCPGDLIIWGVPNAGNPQKAQRFPWDWAQGLRVMAATGARTLCPGHGGPIVDDAALVRRVLHETADLLEQIVDRTLAVLEAGSPPHVDVVRRVELPQSDSPGSNRSTTRRNSSSATSSATTAAGGAAAPANSNQRPARTSQLRSPTSPEAPTHSCSAPDPSPTPTSGWPAT
ncbi:MBL fold metallo-hydrolase [Amycolatopsis sp. WGS_07]